MNTIREITKQLDDLIKRMKGHAKEKMITDAAKELKSKLTAVEE